MIPQPLGVAVVANWRHFHFLPSVCFALTDGTGGGCGKWGWDGGSAAAAGLHPDSPSFPRRLVGLGNVSILKGDHEGYM